MLCLSLLCCATLSAAADASEQLLKSLNLAELPGVLDQSHEQVLAAIGAPHAHAMTNALTHSAFKGMVGEFSLLRRLDEPWDHAPLLRETPFLQVLGNVLAQGVITGYDLRNRDVYTCFAKQRFFIYSHGSSRHLQQLVGVLAAHQVHANVYVTPKVSAFLYREDWGPRSANVQTLPGGIDVVNGRESASLFEFATEADQRRFHELVRQYAKKDQADEDGLIVDAWWQPFYYTNAPFADFPPINLVVVSSDHAEATLTVLPERTETVLQAVSDRGFQTRVEKIWVNPAFHRFLQGDYR